MNQTKKIMWKLRRDALIGMRAGDAGRWLLALLVLVLLWAPTPQAGAVTREFNSSGGTSATNGLHFYIEDTTHIQVRRLNNSGQVYSSTATPPSSSLDNGVFLRADGKVYGPDHTVATFNATGGMFDNYAISALNIANPATSGMQQTATGTFGVNNGPQVSVVWKYTTPLDFLTAEVTLVIPAGYKVSTSNPVRYYHVFDTYLGGSDRGCGVQFTDTNGKLVVGTYPPPNGSTCPSSTGLPAGVTVVESFRERDGMDFSAYCAALWSSFYANGSPNCSVLQTASMSNTIVTSYQDTGIGIEYDFTAAGTYTFSYDFVIGSTTVPPYDHLEIRHDGTTSLCPDNVTVLACISSTVPCPALDIVNTGTLTGSITTTPTTPVITKTPATFSLGSAASTALVALQGVAPGGTYTLGTSGLSLVPLNGTKCWNTTTNTASCSFTVTNSPCISNFECLETGLTYNNLVATPTQRNPLYTKLTGTNFKFDVVALQSSGAVATTYTATQNVKVELFQDTGSACSAYTSPVATQAITFAAGDAGRKTIASNINLARAYGKLLCRVSDSNMASTVYGCSSDRFTVRPLGFSSVTSSASADATGASATATPVLAAGADFSLIANTDMPGYDGTPTLDSSRLEWLGAPVGGKSAPGAGTISGTFSTAASAATGNGATGTTFKYDEVGYFRFQTLGVYDDGASGFSNRSGDRTNGDCTNDASNVLVGGKYGCKFGNTAVTNYFGRFVPHHFALSSMFFTNRSDLSCSPRSSFTYMDEPMTAQFTLTAQSALLNSTTANYAGNFARMALGTPAIFDLRALNSYGASVQNRITAITKANPAVVTTASPHGYATGDKVYINFVQGMIDINNQPVAAITVIDATRFSLVGLDSSAYPAYTSGGIVVRRNASGAELVNRLTPTSSSGSWAAGVAADATIVFRFNRAQDGPFIPEFGIAPVDLDGVALAGFDLDIVSPAGADHASIASTSVRNGRLMLSNAYGSELLGLPVPFVAQYYNGTAYAKNLWDGCTQISVPAGTELVKTPAGITSSATMNGNAATGTFVAGDGKLALSKPGMRGYVDIKPTVPAWLRYPWNGAAAGYLNPSSRATFGVYKTGPVIYMRELY